ncbi:MAG: winged helix-turn-helix transcriptional regulator [Candidatus Heimdallarchaeota archaeon]|nr:winged helix-turn-helix transcriptional regulator [Candidatus Heimdallarchaeota archaeon]
MSDENQDNEKKNTIEDELSKIKEEMQELKEMLKEKRGSEQAEYTDDEDYDDDDDDDHRGFSFKLNQDFDHKFDEMDINMDGIDSTLNNYLSSVMKGVSDNIKRSMEGATRGIHKMEHDFARKAHRQAEKDMRRSEKEFRKTMRKMGKKAKKFSRDFPTNNTSDRVIHLNKLNEEELEEFYEIGTKMTSALSDPRRIKLLKLLEDGPAYQGDLSDKTGVKGGTFKHHMDSLLSSKYVYQEATRGRYLITQLGVEALKLAEMLYRRYKFEEKESHIEENQDESDQVANDMNYEVNLEEDESVTDNEKSNDTVAESPSEELSEFEGDEQ